MPSRQQQDMPLMPSLFKSKAMFGFDADNLPFVRTRQALLVLDLQNDLLAPGGLITVEQPPNLVDNILRLAPEFRNSGNVIWIRSMFEASRPVNQQIGESESVITDAQLSPKHRWAEIKFKTQQQPSGKLPQQHEKISEENGTEAESSLEADDDDSEEGIEAMEETFLTMENGQKPRMFTATSSGTNFCEACKSGIDLKRDLIFQKTWYSAFRDGNLVQILRAKFVTEIYICGALTNISIFATAMDAAQHGYAITIVEDACGYRSEARHDEALRRLTEFTGCDIISSDELVENLQKKAERMSPSPRKTLRPQTRQPRSRKPHSEIDDMMASLNLKPNGSSDSKRRIAMDSPPCQSGPPLATESPEPPQDDESGLKELPKKPEVKRDRVKTKIKTRRRHSKSLPKDNAPSGSAIKDSVSSRASATLEAASKVLENLPAPRTTFEEENLTAGLASLTMTSDEVRQIPETEIKETINVNVDHPDTLSETVVEEIPETLCEGDTTIIKDLLHDVLADNVFEKVRNEVRWQRMSHQGGEVPRLVAVQGEIAEDGSIPTYRHPYDEAPPLFPFSPTVSLIQAQVESKLGHPVNHVLIQYYRDGKDYISEHSDKTLDIFPNTFIANVSLGAQRTMVFRTKKPPKADETVKGPVQDRQAFRSLLPHNSMCKIGLVTNMRWLHAIRQDRRMESEKTREELAYNGGRISLTFRSIGTFLDKDRAKIWGQGATSKVKDKAKNVINGKGPEAEEMVKAFGKENHSPQFDWEESYGKGFDVLHMSNLPKLFVSGDFVADLRIKLMLAEYKVEWVEGKLSPPFKWIDNVSSSVSAEPILETIPLKFVDNDVSNSTCVGDLAIMFYVNDVYGPQGPKSRVTLARELTRIQQCRTLHRKWKMVPFNLKVFRSELDIWEEYAKEAEFLGGSEISMVDFSMFPILEGVRKGGFANISGFQHLIKWYYRMLDRKCVVKVFQDMELHCLDQEHRDASLRLVAGVPKEGEAPVGYDGVSGTWVLQDNAIKGKRVKDKNHRSKKVERKRDDLQSEERLDEKCNGESTRSDDEEGRKAME